MFENVLQVKSALLHEFARQKIVVVGDLMLDKYLWGQAARLSPEAPVPVVRLERRTTTLGGAANLANNLAGLGARVELAGFVGRDSDALLMKSQCDELGIGNGALTALDDFFTIAKTRVLAGEHQLLRLDEENTAPRSNAESDALLSQIEAVLDAQTGALILSDYAKGLATPYFCARLIALCHARQIPLFVDPKGTDYEKYRGASAIKPNRVEIAEIARASGWNWNGPLHAAKRLREWLDLDFVALTLGAQGMAIVDETASYQMPTVAREVFDVSGAGDTVMATLVLGLCSGLDLPSSAALANVAAAEVVAHIGSTPIRLEELLVAVQAQNRVTGARKLYEKSELETLVRAWRAKNRKIAFTNGCFDLFHAGHVRLLEEASARSDKLIVALNSDASIARLKGNSRPLMKQNARVAVLSALECVDAVVIFEDDSPLALIEAVRPDVLAKGADTALQNLVGADFVQSYGGEIALIALVEGLNAPQ